MAGVLDAGRAARGALIRYFTEDLTGGRVQKRIAFISAVMCIALTSVARELRWSVVNWPNRVLALGSRQSKLVPMSTDLSCRRSGPLHAPPAPLPLSAAFPASVVRCTSVRSIVSPRACPDWAAM